MGFLKDLERRTLMRCKWLPQIGAGRASWMQEWMRGIVRDPIQFFQVRTPRDCASCGYHGLFVSADRGRPREHRCPWCKSRPRERFLALLLARHGVDLVTGRVLHFAPEWSLFNRLKDSPLYVGGDIKPRANANAIVDITAIQFPAAAFDVIVSNHVIEHVPNEAAALAECRRVLQSDGVAFVSLPVDMERPTTWEPPSGTPQAEIDRICGWDHKRLYGRDFVDRLEGAGFAVTVERPTDDEMRRYRLLSEDVFFVCRPRGRRAAGVGDVLAGAGA